MLRFGWAGALVIGCIGSLGCGNESSRPPPLGDSEEGSTAVGPDASTIPPGDAADEELPEAAAEEEVVPSGPVFSVSGTVVEDDGTTVVPGVSMCAWGTSTCVTTGTTGAFSLSSVPATGSGVSGTLTGYFKGLWPFTLTGNLMGVTLRMRTNTEVTNWADYVAFSPSQLTVTGAVLAVAYSPGNPDVALASVTVSSAPAGTIGYFTTGTPPQPSSQLAATTPNGSAVILGVSPSNAVVVQFTHAGLTCSADGSNGWPSAQPNTVTVPTSAGALTLARVLCK